MFILAFVSMITYAQSLTVTGKVLDSEGYEAVSSLKVLLVLELLPIWTVSIL